MPEYLDDDESDIFLPRHILDHGSNLGAEVIIGRERHVDGGLHYHVFVDFGPDKRWGTRNARSWDIQGQHPNIVRVAQTPWLSYDYAIKEGDVVLGGAERPDPNSSETNRRSGGAEPGSRAKSGTGNGEDWDYILASETKDEFFIRISERAPKSLVCSYVGVAKYADWKYREVPREYHHPTDWEFSLDSYPDISSWITGNLGRYVFPTPRPYARAGSPTRLVRPDLRSCRLQKIEYVLT